MVMAERIRKIRNRLRLQNRRPNLTRARANKQRACRVCMACPKYFMRKDYYYSKLGSISIIVPQREMIKKIRRALFLIRKIDSREYEKLQSRLRAVFITYVRGSANGLYMPERVWFSNQDGIRKDSITGIAAGLIHEGVHVSQFRGERYVYPPAKMEKLAIAAQQRFLLKAGEKSEAVDYYGDMLRKKYWKKMQQDDRSYAHFRNLLKAYNKNDLQFIRK